MSLSRLVGSVFVVATVLAIPAIAAAGSSSDVIHACISAGSGNLRIVAEAGACRPSETPVQWPAAASQGGETAPVDLSGTWFVQNETIDDMYAGSTGQLTFANGTMTIDSGRFAAAGLVAASESTFCLIPQDPISYQVLSSSVVYVKWVGASQWGTMPQSAVLTIIATGDGTMTMLGNGGCGNVGTPRISFLTKVQ